MTFLSPASALTTLALISGCLVGDPGAGPLPPDAIEDDETTEPSEGGPMVLVLAHGFSGDAASFDDGIADALGAAGHIVYRTEVPSVESVEARAAVLAPQLDAILDETGADRLDIVAHSMGGLDARYVISSLGYADRVRSLTTISTPHLGSPIADASLGLLEGEGAASAALDAIVALVGDVDPDALRRTLVDLSEAEAGRFNEQNPDADGVFYQSWSGLGTFTGALGEGAAELCAGTMLIEPPVPMSFSSLLVLAVPFAGTAATDGVVPVASARWGEFRGCIPADHIVETKSAVADVASFDAVPFYLGIAEQLAARP